MVPLLANIHFKKIFIFRYFCIVCISLIFVHSTLSYQSINFLSIHNVPYNNYNSIFILKFNHSPKMYTRRSNVLHRSCCHHSSHLYLNELNKRTKQIKQLTAIPKVSPCFQYPVWTFITCFSDSIKCQNDLGSYNREYSYFSFIILILILIFYVSMSN